MKKKKINKKRSPAWLEALKRIKIDPYQLELKELKAFKDADRYLNGPVNGPKEWEYLIRNFRFLTSFALTAIYEKQFTPLSSCWEELERLFIHKEIFDDEIFVQSWIFCDFPFGPEKETVLDYYEDFIENPGILNNFQYFIDQMRASRLGLYQEILSSKKIIKIRELFTGKIIKIANTIPDYESGEIFLTRLVDIGGKTYAFGDPKCWPKEYKSHLQNMVRAKLFYFEAPSIEEQYEQFMKYAGPYWMSCVVQDQECPILQPDHYLKYLN